MIRIKRAQFGQKAAVLGVVKHEASPPWQPLVQEHKLHEAEPIDGENQVHKGTTKGKEAKNPGGEVGVAEVEDGVNLAVAGRGSGVKKKAVIMFIIVPIQAFLRSQPWPLEPI